MKNSILKNTLIYGALLSVILAISWTLNRDQHESENNFISVPTTSSEQLAVEIDRLNSKIIELKRSSGLHIQGEVNDKFNKLHHEMVGLRDQLDSLSGTIAANPSDIDGFKNQEDLLSEEEQEEVVKRQIEEQFALYDDIAAQEGVDQEWANDAQIAIYESFNNLADSGGVSVSAAICHRTFCQVSFDLDNGDSGYAFEKLQEFVPWEDGESLLWIENIEQGEGRIYLAREGYKLPDSDN